MGPLQASTNRPSAIGGDRVRLIGSIGARLWPVTVLVRLLIAAVLVLGPATDEPAELSGWDAERFQAIAERDGRAYLDEPVEYPPGSVAVFDVVAGADVVATHRRLVTLSVGLDLATAALLWRRFRRSVGLAFLWLGLPLVPLGYQRLDTLVTFVAVIGVLALLPRSDGPVGTGAADPDPTTRRRRRYRDGLVAVAATAGALIKVWPALLVVAAIGLGRVRAAVAAIVLGAGAGVVWLVGVGAGLEPVDQVLSLRGATGWHVESLIGALVALVSADEAVLEFNAYRIGTLQPAVVTAGRLVAVASMAALAALAYRRATEARGGHRALDRSATERAGLVLLGSTAALVVTAPLLSPQFMVWLVPWAALSAAAGRTRPPADAPGSEADRPRLARAVRWWAPLAMTAAAGVLTGFTLTLFRPHGLATPLPAALLSLRNLVLLGLPVVCAIRLVVAYPPTAPTVKTR